MPSIAFIASLLLHALVAFLCISGGIKFSKKPEKKEFTVFEFQQLAPKSQAPVLSDKSWHVSKDQAQKAIKNDKAQEIKTAEKVKQKVKKTQKIQVKQKGKENKKVKPKITANNVKKSNKEKKLVDLRENKKSSKKALQTAKKKSFDSIVNNPSAKKSAENTGIKAEKEGNILSSTQIDLVRQKIKKCWHYHTNLTDTDSLIVNIRLELNQSGKIIKAEIMDKDRMSDPAYRTAAENALRAVNDPECNTLPLPKEHYKEWKIIEMSFDPSD